MSEQLPAPNTLDYSVAVVTNNPAWKERFGQYTEVLNPNGVAGVIDSINIHEIDEEATVWKRPIEGLGTLKYLDQGESKVALHLETNSGQNMVVKITNLIDRENGQSSREPSVFAPEDPKMVKVKSGLGKDLYEYSDLETLLVVDTGRFELQFQEFGYQPKQSSTRKPLEVIQRTFSRARAVHRMIDHVEGSKRYKPAQNWYEAAKAELEKTRHQLEDGSGRSVLIDIPVELLK